jgi:predicted DNA-binding protein
MLAGVRSMNSSIKVKKELLQRIERYATAAGYSSAQEFVEHIVERELAKLEDAQSDEEIARKLKGLGYID